VAIPAFLHPVHAAADACLHVADFGVAESYLLVAIVCLLFTLPMMMHRMASIWPEGAMQRLFAFVAMVPIGIVAFVVLRKRQSWERALIQNRINA
jgi:hypothetical protein